MDSFERLFEWYLSLAFIFFLLPAKSDPLVRWELLDDHSAESTSSMSVTHFLYAYKSVTTQSGDKINPCMIFQR